ncbi:MAG TPA: nucleotidyltransferase domain-containing protein [Thermoanaerobaculia bacterium]|jgi:hypothetical protein|nr:nucleotidyltransferase domain-containing protein [Thermoanaerobaculia bacterium]
MQSRDQIVEILRDNAEGLRRDFGVESVALFGSVARGEAGPFSDIDLLVDVPKPISLFQLVALQLRLQALLGHPKVDVVLRDSIFPPLRDLILAEEMRVA